MIRRMFLLACAIIPSIAQTLPRYDIYRAAGRIVIDGKLDEPAWQQAPSVGDFHFNWWKDGEKEMQYKTSDEYAREWIESNEPEFTEDGSLYR